MDKDFTIPRETLFFHQRIHPKAIRNRNETINLLEKHEGLSGNVLDIGERNYFTEVLEKFYKIPIHSTIGDLDIEFIHPGLRYDFVHYNNVIEHQFNPLFTLLKIHEVLKDDGILILGTPVKPTWITFSSCHFHEFDQYRFDKLINRAGFEVVDCLRYWHDLKIFGIRGLLGSFYPKQSIYLLKKNLLK